MKRLTRVLALMMIGCAVFFGGKLDVCATGTVYYDTVTDRTVDEEGYYIVKAASVDAVVDALKEAQEKATEAQPYKIVVKPSEEAYVMEKAFAFYSNIYLYAQGATFKQASGLQNNMLRTGNDDNVTGYYYKNITVDGGVWDENKNSNTLAKFAQGENIVIKNATFKNSKQGHLMEIAGVNGLNIDNCVFKDQVIPKQGNKVYEAVQFDLLVEGHLKGYKYQDLTTKNVTITNCSFDNVPRGIGCHTTVLNNPIDGMVITNNTFTNIKSCAVQFMNIVNCTVRDNTITNSPRGVTIFGAVFDNQDTYLAKTLSTQGKTTSSTSNKYQKPAEDSKIVIENNNITIGGTDPYSTYERSGVLVQGVNKTKTYKSSSGDKIPKGDYYISGVTVNNNVVKGSAHGVKLLNVRNGVVTNNTFTFSGSMNKNYYGVQLKNKSTKIAISMNNMTKYYNGIYLKNATAGDILQNTIQDVKKYGISVEDSTVGNVSSNIIEKAKVNGIYLLNGKTADIDSNSVKDTGKHGISVEKSTAGNIKNNILEKIKVNAVYVLKGKASNIESNTIKDAKKYGVSIENSTVKNINTNTINKVKVNAIYVKDSKANNIKSNTLKDASKYGISIERSKANIIDSNAVTKTKSNGIHIWDKSTVKNITNNKLTSVKFRGIYVGGKSKVTTIKKNKFKSCKEKIFVNPDSKVKSMQKVK